MSRSKLERLEEAIHGIKREIGKIGALRPGSLSKQARKTKTTYGAYWHLSYTHGGKGHTQYIRDAFVPQECPEKVGNYPMGGIFSPFGASPVLICPGANGGSEWTAQSYNPQTEMMYVCGIHQPQIWTGISTRLAQSNE